MGCSPEDDRCADEELPAHQVRLTRGFWMGRTEVTQAAYQRVINRKPSVADGAFAAFDKFGFNRTNDQVRAMREQLPVESVTWNEAAEYCRAVGLRLPTEAEWEYAARAGTTGARYGDLDKVAWHYGFGKSSRPVATKEPNAWGLYDMLGNVAEWTADWLGPYRPNKATDPRGPGTGQYRVIRGGNWDEQGPIRVSERSGTIYRSSWSIGFRCAGDLR
jgi:formylglycine-generating enzyme required for sulfatase activity